MQGIGEAIKYFYQQFILRDVLAYVTSGAILAGCVLFLHYGDLTAVVEFSRTFHLLPLSPFLAFFS
jgi:hypothetical protein